MTKTYINPNAQYAIYVFEKAPKTEYERNLEFTLVNIPNKRQISTHHIDTLIEQALKSGIIDQPLLKENITTIISNSDHSYIPANNHLIDSALSWYISLSKTHINHSETIEMLN